MQAGQLFYASHDNVTIKIHNGEAPTYLSTAIPDKRESIPSYNTRNKHIGNYFISRCRLELFKKSVVPDSIRLWNLFKAEAREAISSINSFRKNISVEIENLSICTRGRAKNN